MVVAGAVIAPVLGRGLGMCEQFVGFAEILNFHYVKVVTLWQGDQWRFPNCPKAEKK